MRRVVGLGEGDMATPSIRRFSATVTKDQTARAYQIVKYAHESSRALHDAFKKLKGSRRGAATDEEQDVLRAMLVSAGAGLDSALKQIFKDCLQDLLIKDEQVKTEFAKFIDKALRKGTAESDIDTKLIAEALATPLPIFHLAERYVYDLTGSSLQSASQLFAAANALGLDPMKDVKLDKKKLKPVFDARNKIVHELDIDFSGARRNRVQRKVEDMVNMSNHLLNAAQRFVELVDKKVP